MHHLPFSNRWEASDWHACVCEQTWYAPRSAGKCLLTAITLRRAQNLHPPHFCFPILFAKGTEANREDRLWQPPSFGLISPLTNSPSDQNTGEERRWGESYFQDKNKNPVFSDSVSVHKQKLLVPASCASLLFSAAPFLPPGEEGPSALETLRVGLTVSSLWCPRSFNDNWGHLDQLEGCFTILQGLAQIQNLGIEKGKKVTTRI